VKNISLYCGLVIAGLLLVVEASQADSAINLATLNLADSVATPTLTLAKLEPVVIDADGQMQLDRVDFAPAKEQNQQVQKQQKATSNASWQEDINPVSALFRASIVITFIIFLICALRDSVRRSYINAHQLPDAVLKNFCRQYPLLDDEQVQRVVEALNLYFCSRAPYPKQNVPIPSRLVNDLWRAFSLQVEDYEFFCQEAFRYKLPYRDIDKLVKNAKDYDWSVIWQYACSREDSYWLPKKLPSIFAIDADFNIENGLHYDLASCVEKWRLSD
jgi:hypothetical protein